MLSLSQAIQHVLNIYRAAGVSESTYQSRRRYCDELRRKAKELDKNFFDQELAVSYMRDNRGSREVRGMHRSICKKIDAVCHLKLLDLSGHYLNPLKYPSKKDAEDCFQKNYPNNKYAIPYVHLAIYTYEVVKENRATESTSGQYLKALKEFTEWVHLRGNTNYSEDDCRRWLKYNDKLHQEGSIKKWVWKIRRRSLFVMTLIMESGKFSWRKITNERFPLPEELALIEKRYLHDQEVRGLEQKTLQLHRYVAHYALHAYITGATLSNNLADANLKDMQRILHYFSERCKANSMGTIVPILRSFLGYLTDHGHIRKGLEGFAQPPRHARKRAKGFFSSSDERRIARMLEKIDKRDKAIVLFAMETGLRECDILGLHFSQIDWNNESISVLQQKTGKTIVLPLLTDVGNALVDYILNERPKVPAKGHTQFIFLQKQAPFRRIKSFYAISRDIYELAQARPVNSSKSGGLHLLRHTLTYRLLKDKVPPETITQVLGHADRESDKSYLSLDDEMLMECAMEDPLTSVEEVWR